jgi:hypothetical protein
MAEYYQTLATVSMAKPTQSIFYKAAVLTLGVNTAPADVLYLQGDEIEPQFNCAMSIFLGLSGRLHSHL